MAKKFDLLFVEIHFLKFNVRPAWEIILKFHSRVTILFSNEGKKIRISST